MKGGAFSRSEPTIALSLFPAAPAPARFSSSGAVNSHLRAHKSLCRANASNDSATALRPNVFFGAFRCHSNPSATWGGGGRGLDPPPPFKGARLVVRTRRWRDCPLVRDRGSGGRRGLGRCPEGAVHARVGEGQAGPPEATHSAAEGTPVPLAAAGGPRGAGLEGGPWCRQSGYWWLGQPRRGPVWRFQTTGWWAAGSGRRHWYPRAFWVACRQGVGGHELGHQRAVNDGGWAVAGGGWTVTDGGGARPSGAAQRSTTKKKRLDGAVKGRPASRSAPHRTPPPLHSY